MPISSLDTPPSSPSSGTPTAAGRSAPGPRMGGSRTCMCTKVTPGCSIHPTGRDEWISSMRASLARILARQGADGGSTANEAGSCGRSSGQLTLYALDTFFSRTHHGFGPGGETVSLPPLWRVDTPGATERLPRLMSAHGRSGNAGGVLLPTLTVYGNWNKKGSAPNSGDGLITVLNKMPTLIARDARTVAGSQPMRRDNTRSGIPLTWHLGKDWV